jgi:hypothetical protein
MKVWPSVTAPVERLSHRYAEIGPLAIRALKRPRDGDLASVIGYFANRVDGVHYDLRKSRWRNGCEGNNRHDQERGDPDHLSLCWWSQHGEKSFLSNVVASLPR